MVSVTCNRKERGEEQFRHCISFGLGSLARSSQAGFPGKESIVCQDCSVYALKCQITKENVFIIHKLQARYMILNRTSNFWRKLSALCLPLIKISFKKPKVNTCHLFVDHPLWKQKTNLRLWSKIVHFLTRLHKSQYLWLCITVFVESGVLSWLIFARLLQVHFVTISGCV